MPKLSGLPVACIDDAALLEEVHTYSEDMCLHPSKYARYETAPSQPLQQRLPRGLSLSKTTEQELKEELLRQEIVLKEQLVRKATAEAEHAELCLMDAQVSPHLNGFKGD